jgi:uncharacterized RDD family membrane protein YckC
MSNQLMTNGWSDFSGDEEPSVSNQCVAEHPESAPGPNNSTATLAANPSLSANAEPNSEPSSEPSSDRSSDSWRDEVTARLERYRTRRKPRTPHYPSLLLPFDAPESWSRPTPALSVSLATPPGGQDFASETNLARNSDSHSRNDNASTAAVSECSAAPSRDWLPSPSPDQSLEFSSNLIEFPRSAAMPVFHASDLADPVFDYSRPRIVEAPEILPPPPALGGMLIEPSPQELADKSAQSVGIFPSTSASIRQRTLAALVDGLLLATSLGAFAAIFLHLNPSLKPFLNPSLTNLRASAPLTIGALAAIAVLFWAAYQFFFVVYTGSTPGLRVARLRVAAFDGSPLNRSARRWRVLASFLSALSAGLGYLWCLLDQHGLCWHDRITRTHVQAVRLEK